jgi:hypothetical protein
VYLNTDKDKLKSSFPNLKNITISLGSVDRNCTFRMFSIITITYPLHVSAPTGHLEVEYIYIYIYIYWLLPKEQNSYTGT